MATDRTFLLVDGNNIIHAWPELKDLHLRGKGLAHERLKHLLGGYQDVSGERVVLVFDGRNERMESQPNRDEHEVQVFYSDSSHTADDIIERLSAKYAKRYRLTVATNDLAEQSMVHSLGADVISSDGLRLHLENTAGVMDDWINRYRRDSEIR
ncbi:MAG: NYN domain-containing protein [Verrucomicrobia bacterium]|nr:NYN domain-containing protein [Verrucomicrobiota bacterium]